MTRPAKADTPDTPFDPGLQLERTLLAWGRTCLALAAVAVVTIRYLVPVHGAIVLAGGTAGLVLAGGAYYAAARRYRTAHRRLIREAGLPGGAAPIMALAGTTVLLATAGLGLAFDAAFFP